MHNNTLTAARNLHTAYERRQVLTKGCSFTQWDDLDATCQGEFIELAALIIAAHALAEPRERTRFLCNHYNLSPDEKNRQYFNERIYEAMKGLS